jgi:hypothetical protein
MSFESVRGTGALFCTSLLGWAGYPRGEGGQFEDGSYGHVEWRIAGGGEGPGHADEEGAASPGLVGMHRDEARAGERRYMPILSRRRYLGAGWEEQNPRRAMVPRVWRRGR